MHRSCFHGQSVPDGRRFLPADKAIFRSNPDGLQGKATQYADKNAGQTVCNGCENSFLDHKTSVDAEHLAGVNLSHSFGLDA